MRSRNSACYTHGSHTFLKSIRRTGFSDFLVWFSFHLFNQCSRLNTKHFARHLSKLAKKNVKQRTYTNHHHQHSVNTRTYTHIHNTQTHQCSEQIEYSLHKHNSHQYFTIYLITNFLRDFTVDPVCYV